MIDERTGRVLLFQDVLHRVATRLGHGHHGATSTVVGDTVEGDVTAVPALMTPLGPTTTQRTFDQAESVPAAGPQLLGLLAHRDGPLHRARLTRRKQPAAEQRAKQGVLVARGRDLREVQVVHRHLVGHVHPGAGTEELVRPRMWRGNERRGAHPAGRSRPSGCSRIDLIAVQETLDVPCGRLARRKGGCILHVHLRGSAAQVARQYPDRDGQRSRGGYVREPYRAP